MDILEWIKSVVIRAATENLSEEPQDVIVFSGFKISSYPDIPFPIRASLIMKDRTVLVTLNIYRDGRFDSFTVIN